MLQDRAQGTLGNLKTLRIPLYSSYTPEGSKHARRAAERAVLISEAVNTRKNKVLLDRGMCCAARFQTRLKPDLLQDRILRE